MKQFPFNIPEKLNHLTELKREIYIDPNSITKYDEKINSFIDSTISEIKEEINNKKNINENLKNEIYNLNKFLNIHSEIKNFSNLELENQYLNYEKDRLEILKNKLKIEFKSMIEKLDSLRTWLGFKEEFDQIFTLKNFIELENLIEKYQKLKEEKEIERLKYYRFILKSYQLLKTEMDDIDLMIINDQEQVSFDDLSTKYQAIKNEIKNRENVVKTLIEDIDLLRNNLIDHYTLNEEPTDEITDKNIQQLNDILTLLKNEQEKYFERIFDSSLNVLKELCQIFSIETIELNKSPENLGIIRKIIEELSIKKESFLKICELIEKYEAFKNKMIEFEKNASDPKRLFKSSVQLNKEEKFRKNAFPNLLRIEHEIIRELTHYENEHGDFIYKGIVFREIFEKERENRIINGNVFIINKNETPKKKFYSK